MTKEELHKVIAIITTHAEGEGQYCDTGDDMDWFCRSECMSLAVDRLTSAFSRGEFSDGKE